MVAPITHLLYLHGFRSSPQSKKARATAAWMQQHRPAITWFCPQLPPSPRAAVELVSQQIVAWGRLPRRAQTQTPQPAQTQERTAAPATLGIIGSSLGGFYATVLAERHGCRVVLLNPAVHPARDLARHIRETRVRGSEQAAERWGDAAAERCRGDTAERYGGDTAERYRDKTAERLAGDPATWRDERIAERCIVDTAEQCSVDAAEQCADERFFFSADFIDELRAIAPPAVLTRPDRYLAVIAKGDELLSWVEMNARYQGACIKLLEGGDHALSDFEDHLPDVMHFLGLTEPEPSEQSGAPSHPPHPLHQ